MPPSGRMLTRPRSGVAVVSELGECVEGEVEDHPAEPGLKQSVHMDAEHVVLKDPASCGRVLEHGGQRERHARTGLACCVAARVEFGRPVKLTLPAAQADIVSAVDRSPAAGKSSPNSE